MELHAVAAQTFLDDHRASFVGSTEQWLTDISKRVFLDGNTTMAKYNAAVLKLLYLQIATDGAAHAVCDAVLSGTRSHPQIWQHRYFLVTIGLRDDNCFLRDFSLEMIANGLMSAWVTGDGLSADPEHRQANVASDFLMPWVTDFVTLEAFVESCPKIMDIVWTQDLCDLNALLLTHLELVMRGRFILLVKRALDDVFQHPATFDRRFEAAYNNCPAFIKRLQRPGQLTPWFRWQYSQRCAWLTACVA